MPPKAKAKAKALAMAKVRAKARAKAKAGPPAMRVGRRAMRRPAGGADEAPMESVEEKWARGAVVKVGDVPPILFSEGTPVVLPTAHYYLRSCAVAGRLTGLEVKDGAMYALARLTGTTGEALLKYHTANPDAVFRVHLCRENCNQQEVSDLLLHTKQIRQIVDMAQEEGWVSNLEKVRPMEEGDELEVLRARQRGLGGEPKVGDGVPGGEPERSRKDKKEDRKKKKEKRKGVGDRRARSASSEETVKMDGTMAKRAAKKKPGDLFRGTGLDPKEKVRRQVAKRARRSIRKKSKKDDSTLSSGSTGSSGDSQVEAEEETVFQQASKVRLVASGFPGTLASQTLAQMRTVLLSEVGSEDRPGVLKGCALAYFRQHVSKRSTGPAQRELLSIATSIDMMLNGNAAGAMDILVQPFKSVESTVTGCHWTVAQRLEVVPPDNVQLTPAQEMQDARRNVYEESRLRWLAAQPDGRSATTAGKGANRTKGEGKEPPKGTGKGRWGKGPQGKQDANKRKDEATSKP